MFSSLSSIPFCFQKSFRYISPSLVLPKPFLSKAIVLRKASPYRLMLFVRNHFVIWGSDGETMKLNGSPEYFSGFPFVCISIEVIYFPFTNIPAEPNVSPRAARNWWDGFGMEPDITKRMAPGGIVPLTKPL